MLQSRFKFNLLSNFSGKTGFNTLREMQAVTYT